MNASAIDWSILGPACVAGLIVSLTHVPLGAQVLQRGIVFIDLAIAQIAGIGVVVGNLIGLEPRGWGVQACALLAASAGALFLTWTDRRYPEVQEAIIGTTFVLTASGTLLLLAGHPHGGEHLKELLVGQILWVRWDQLIAVAAIYALLLWPIAKFPAERSRIAFYLVFAGSVTISVQLVGLYLVFATLIVPALATRRVGRYRLAAAYLLSTAGYVAGAAASAAMDLPTGPTIVCAMITLALAVFLWIALTRREAPA
jgi:zinc/manganese transport system permease protein